jgi:hypothetical protein
MHFVWPVLLLFFRSLYLLYTLWCLSFLFVLLGLVLAWATEYPPLVAYIHSMGSTALWGAGAGFTLVGTLMLWGVYSRRTVGDPNPFQSGFLSWFGTIKWFWNAQPGAMVKLALPSGYLVENPGGYRLSGRDTREVLDLLQPGDILLRGYRGYVDGVMIRLASRCSDKGFRPGWYTHAALFVGHLGAEDRTKVPAEFANHAEYFEEGAQMVVHSMAKGVHTEDILTFIRCDYLTVLRLKPEHQSEVQHAKDSALGKIGHAYDFNSDDTQRFHRFSCSELVYYCLRNLHAALDLKPTVHALYPLPKILPRMSILKRNTVVPDDYYELAENGVIDCVWEDRASRAAHPSTPRPTITKNAKP